MEANPAEHEHEGGAIVPTSHSLDLPVLTRSSAIADKPPDATIWWVTATYWPDFPIFTYPGPICRTQWGSPRAVGFLFGTRKLEWLCYNLVKVAWWSPQSLGYIASTWQTDRHVATVNARQSTTSGSNNTMGIIGLHSTYWCSSMLKLNDILISWYVQRFLLNLKTKVKQRLCTTCTTSHYRPTSEWVEA